MDNKKNTEKIKEIIKVFSNPREETLEDAANEILNLFKSSGESEDLREAERIFEEEEGRKVNWSNSKDELVVSCMQVAISHVKGNRV